MIFGQFIRTIINFTCSYFLYLGVVWIGRCVYSSEVARHYIIFLKLHLISYNLVYSVILYIYIYIYIYMVVIFHEL